MNFYNKVANVLSDIERNKISFKTAIYKYTSYDGDRNFKKVYKLVVEILKCKKILKEIMENFFQSDDVNNLEVLKVLCYEKFFSDLGNKKKIGGKLMRMLKDKEHEIKKYIEANYKQAEMSKYNNDNNLIYFRINSQIKDTKALVEFISQNADENDGPIHPDDLIEGLFSVSKSNHKIVKKIFEYKNSSQVIMQTKSSCLPAYILKLIQIKESELLNTDVIDTCSAPGNKTLQLSEYFSGKSKIFAFEIDSKRFEILKQNVEKNNFSKNIHLLNKDFLTADPFDPKFANVRVILSDPSCSGSGTLNNSIVDNQEGEEFSLKSSLSSNCCLDLAGSDVEKEKVDRLTKLAKFQMKILEHCMKFPNVKYISYSTCSIFMTENEYVVSNVLKRNKNFRLFDIFTQKEFREMNQNEEGTFFHKGLTEGTENTLRTCRLCHNIDGFYVAIFEKI